MNYVLPTKANIVRGLKWLTQGAVRGDSLFFSFSGHGTQSRENADPDSLAESIFPVDFRNEGTITDEALHGFLAAVLPAGVRLTAVVDSAHSGAGLDLPYFVLPGYGQAAQAANSKIAKRYAVQLKRGGTPQSASYATLQKDKRLIHADVFCFSASRDFPTGPVVPNKAGGGLTGAFLQAAQAHSGEQSFAGLLQNIAQTLTASGLPQTPELTLSRPFDLNTPFNL